MDRIDNSNAAARRAAAAPLRFARALAMLAAPCGLVSLIAACSSVPLNQSQPAPITEAPAGPAKHVSAAAASSRSVATVQAPSSQALTAAQLATMEPAGRSIYFDFDQAVIKTAYDTVVENNARFLASHPSLRVVVQGNTDERGGAEYNLALGQARADRVAKEMELVGVRANQVATVSFGAEKPKAGGHDESAWAQNRRADIVYNG